MNEIKKKKLFKYGSEGTIYEVDNYLFKRFISNKKTKNNKLEKLLLLDKINEIKKYYNQIIGIVYSEYIEGYMFKKINGVPLYEYHGKKKIKILKELRDILDIFKEYGVYYLDFNLGNVYIQNNKVKLIDIDNIKIDKYDVDLVPNLYQKYYELGGTDINKAMIFVFNIISILTLINKNNINIMDVPKYDYLDYEIIYDLANLKINSSCDNTYLIDKIK